MSSPPKPTPSMPPVPPSSSETNTGSAIPTGPSPDRKDMTAGWNDPPKIISKSDCANPLRREKKAKKTVASPPTDFPVFNPK
jgi:hypothetical protein